MCECVCVWERERERERVGANHLRHNWHLVTSSLLPLVATSLIQTLSLSRSHTHAHARTHTQGCECKWVTWAHLLNTIYWTTGRTFELMRTNTQKERERERANFLLNAHFSWSLPLRFDLYPYISISLFYLLTQSLSSSFTLFRPFSHSSIHLLCLFLKHVYAVSVSYSLILSQSLFHTLSRSLCVSFFHSHYSHSYSPLSLSIR